MAHNAKRKSYIKNCKWYGAKQAIKLINTNKPQRFFFKFHAKTIDKNLLEKKVYIIDLNH